MAAKRRRKFTDESVHKLPAPAQGQATAFYWDSEVNRLGVRVTASGARAYIFQYRHAGKPQRATLAKVRDVALEVVRARARQWNAWLRQGLDPQAEERRQIEEERQRREREAAARVTFADLLEEYDREEAAGRKSGEELLRLLRKDALPAWEHKPITEITRRDVVLLLDTVYQRAPVTANRLMGRLVRLFNFAAERGLLEVNPIAGLKRKHIESGRETCIPDEELRTFWEGVDRSGASELTKLALKLILVTGQRPGDVAGATWDEFDLDAATWVIPAARYKGGREHDVPLPPLAVALLQQAKALGAEVMAKAGKPAPQGEQQRWVFPGGKGGGPVTVRALSRAVKRMQAPDRKGPKGGPAPQPDFTLSTPQPVVPHDLRRTCRTQLAALGVDDIVAEKVLGHQLQGLLRVYNQHAYWDERRAALLHWDAHLRERCNLPPATTPANVVPLHG